MLRAIEDWICRSLDRDISWWGLRRFKPAPDRPYTARLLVLVCLAYGLPLAAMGWAGLYAATSLANRFNPLTDDRDWLPRAAAVGLFAYNGALNAACACFWNRRAKRLDATAARGDSGDRG